MKTLLCCIARMENDYIREWVEYNKNIGFTNICLYDNNFDGEQDFHDVIGDYIENGYVILKDYRNRMVCQLEAYTECYAEYGNYYDWIAFFDSDEFISLNGYKDITSYLSDPKFNNFYTIRVNWLMYGDNDMLYNNGKPIIERFKYPLPIYQYVENRQFKSIVRGRQKIKTDDNCNGFEFLNPHMVNLYHVCNNSGISIDFTSTRIPINYDSACLNHYCSKTAREYCNKISRGFPDHDINLLKNRKEQLINLVFFKMNSVTSEKVQIFKDVLGIDVSYLLK